MTHFNFIPQPITLGEYEAERLSHFIGKFTNHGLGVSYSFAGYSRPETKSRTVVPPEHEQLWIEGLG